MSERRPGGTAMRPRVPRVCTTGALRVSARRAPVEVMRVLELFEFTAKHFHEKPSAKHGFGLSWLRPTGADPGAHGGDDAAPGRHRATSGLRASGGT